MSLLRRKYVIIPMLIDIVFRFALLLSGGAFRKHLLFFFKNLVRLLATTLCYVKSGLKTCVEGKFKFLGLLLLPQALESCIHLHTHHFSKAKTRHYVILTGCWDQNCDKPPA